MRPSLWLLSSLFSMSLAAQDTSTTDAAQETTDDNTEVLTVVATRSEQKLSDIPAAVSLITSEDILEQGAQDIRDLIRYEPGISVSGTGSQWGLDGFTIRGIGGNRVLTTVDGVRVSDEFTFGPFLSSRRDFVDVDSLNRVEIVRGPVSSLYGSDAMAGVVAFSTFSPRQYLHEGDTMRTNVRAGHASSNNLRALTGRLALGNENLASILTVTSKQSNEFANLGEVDGFGPTRELPDPLDSSGTSISSKTSLQLADGHDVELKLERYSNDSETMVYSDYNTSVRGTVVTRRDATSNRERQQFVLTYRGAPTMSNNRFEVVAYGQTSETAQLTTEDRTSQAYGEHHRSRSSNFEQRVNGLNARSSLPLTFGAMEHRFTLGLDYLNTNLENQRDGSSTYPDGTPILNPFATFPTRDFPTTTVTQTALYLQDEISLFDSRLKITPGVRMDSFKADPEADEVLRIGNPGISDPASYEDDELTTKLSALYQIADGVAIFALRNEGFRAPPYDDVNVGFTNFLGGYKTISNPDLSSETSVNVEFGARLSLSRVQARIGAYRSEFENFIESLAPAMQFAQTGGVDPSDGLFTFQSRNRGSVEISGVEIAGAALLTERISAKFAIATAKGEDNESMQPLSSVEPRTTVSGLRYNDPDDRWSVEAVLTNVGEKDMDDIDPGDNRMQTDAYTLFDVFGNVRIGQRLSVYAGLYNLTDQSYIRWGDTRSIGFDAPLRFTQPGRNLSLSAVFDW